MYFGKRDLYNLIKRVGGEWNDTKDRPIFCCIESLEHKGLYWAIPVGNYNHRDASAKRRINNFINLPPKYIERGYINNYTASIHIVKNKTLISELENKLKRILAYENSNPNFFRQHITDVKNELLKELI